MSASDGCRCSGSTRERPVFLGPVTAVLVAVLVGVLLACNAGDPAPSTSRSSEVAAPVAAVALGGYFEDATEAAGLDFVHFNGMSGDFTMAEEMGAGGALFDFDNDGDLDLYLVQGRMLGDKLLEAATFQPRHGLPLSDRLYRNELVPTGSFGFVDITESIGLHATGFGMGVAVADVDNDGWPDLYTTNVGPNQLLRNRGVGTDGIHRGFEDVTTASGTNDPGFSVPAVFFDFDRDGWLDLYIGNYVQERRPAPVCRLQSGSIDYCGPASYAPAGDRLLRNVGEQATGMGVRFEEVTAEAGWGDQKAPALGAVAFDADRDGWFDLYVANDDAPNHLWMNQGDGTFVDAALIAGCAVDADGRSQGSMGLVAADLDCDGDTDLFATHRVTETNTLYRNDGTGQFDDATRGSGLGPPSRRYTAFGAAALDVDLDGLLDLLVANGAVNTIEAQVVAGDPHPLREPNQLFLARRDKTTGSVGFKGASFEDTTTLGGAGLSSADVSRGLVQGDVDNDGDTDVIVVNNAGPAQLLLNTSSGRHTWLGLRLVGIGRSGSPVHDLLGARVALLHDDESVAWRRVATDGSYVSANDPRVRFALPGPVAADPDQHTVRVVWPDGSEERYEGLDAGRYHELVRGSGS